MKEIQGKVVVPKGTTETTVVTFVLQYTDPEYTVEGAVKTRHFDKEEEAWRQLEWLSTYRPDITDAKLIKQTSRIIKERLH